MDLKEYNHLLYVRNYRRNFVRQTKSYSKILEAIGYTVTPPADEETANTLIDAYLARRPRRERFVEGGGAE